MNTFILAFHPRGRSMVQYLCEAGYEVWTSNLRGQGDSVAYGQAGRVGFAEIALVDIPQVVDYVRAETQSQSPKVHGIGCSLGGTFLYAYLAHHPNSHSLASMVGLGAPLKWENPHLLLKAAFRWPQLVSKINVRGTRRAARWGLPLAKRIPGLLSIYMNTDHIDLSQADLLTQTVDDPHPHLNTQIAHWVTNEDLVVRGLNISRGLKQVKLPLLAVHANADGIVPSQAAVSATEAIGGKAQALQAGDSDRWFAHADMFINDRAESEVFEPVAQWLSALG
jgi:alpha-beta hydrolase superfamily lysophospholipase